MTAGELLLDRFAPRADFTLHEELVVDAPPRAVYAAVGKLRPADLRSARSRLLIWARALPERLRAPRRVLGFDEVLLGERWVFLGEREGSEIVLGAAGRFWRPFTIWDEISAEAFRDYSRPRSATVALAFSVRPNGEGRSTLAIDTRITAVDPAARRWAGRYWRSIHPAAHLIARELLGATSALAAKE